MQKHLPVQSIPQHQTEYRKSIHLQGDNWEHLVLMLYHQHVTEWSHLIADYYPLTT